MRAALFWSLCNFKMVLSKGLFFAAHLFTILYFKIVDIIGCRLTVNSGTE